MEDLLTTANMDLDVFLTIDNFSKITGISKSDIAIKLIKMLLDSYPSKRILGRLIEYQSHSPEEWIKMNYSVDMDDAELLSFSRQKYKISISKMIFIGFLLFWNKLVKKLLKTSNSSEIQNSYLCLKVFYKKIIENFEKKLINIKLE